MAKNNYILEKKIYEILEDKPVVIIPPQDVLTTLKSLKKPVTTTILDPWYNKGIGGLREDYIEWLAEVLSESCRISDHIFVWGFPEIIYKLMDHIPEGFELVTWLTWYFKNCPSVIKGWRSAQNTCLHIAKKDANMYVEHFLNEKQLKLKEEGKLRYMPGPPSVLEVPLNIGFVGKKEQTGHPSQKPEKVIEPLIKMTTIPGDIVLDPMAGSGTTGAVCINLGRKSILCDGDEEYTKIIESRLNSIRIHY